MTVRTVVVGCLCLGLVGTLVTVARGVEPRPKRTRLIKDDDGERADPFADIPGKAEATAGGYRDCGAPLETEPFRYCVSCGGASDAVADD